MKFRMIDKLLLVALLALSTGSPALSDAIRPLAPAGTPASDFPKPDRPVAEIISPIWATERERDAAKESEQIIQQMGLKPGMSVADIGAGSGYHTVRLSRALGPQGHVYAQDVMPEYLSKLQMRTKALTNVTVSLGEPHDPRLPAGSIDAAILVHMYHEIEQPFALLYNLAPALKPGGIVGIVDLDRVTWQHGTPPDLLRCEMAAVGYQQVAFATLTGGVGYLATFKVEEGRRVEPKAIKPCAVSRGKTGTAPSVAQ